MIVLSHYQANQALAARAAGLSVCPLSLDLNRSTVHLALAAEGLHLPGLDSPLGWAAIDEIAAHPNACFEVSDAGIEEIRVYSEATHWVRSLYPTPSAPSTLVSGMVMHRIEGIDPMRDTLEKIAAARPGGRVLDTCTGLGYTAIEAAKAAESVDTVELDPAALELCHRNPWSQALFSTENLRTHVADVFDFVEACEDGAYSCVIHDPPTFQFAGELYSGDFYEELFRVLTRRGRLYHYVGDPASKAVQRVLRGASDRLSRAGFQRIEKAPRAFGLVAHK